MLNMMIFGISAQLFAKTVYVQAEKLWFSNLGHVFRTRQCSSRRWFFFVDLRNLNNLQIYYEIMNFIRCLIFVDLYDNKFKFYVLWNSNKKKQILYAIESFIPETVQALFWQKNLLHVRFYITEMTSHIPGTT